MPDELVGRNGPGLVCGRSELMQEGIVLIDPVVAEGRISSILNALAAVVLCFLLKSHPRCD
eukprot:10682993-Alexandrium_andersonii.AAC.1